MCLKCKMVGVSVCVYGCVCVGVCVGLDDVCVCRLCML